MVAMRRVPFVVLAALTACGDDQDDLDSGPAADGAATSTAATDDDAVGDDDDALDDAVDDAADDDGAGETTSGAAEGSGSSASDGDADGEDAEVACLPAEVFDALQQHTADLRAASYLLAGEPSEDTMTGFLLAPGLPMPPAVPSMTLGDVMAACEEAIALPVVCDVGSCRLLQCTEDGWITQLWVIPPVASDGWVFTQVRVQTRWIAGETGTTFRER